jgi:putative nucleotidyltransferase with HDIG domain
MHTILEALPQEFQQFREIVEALAKLVLQFRLFPASHPAIGRALDRTYRLLDAALQRKKSVKLTFSDGIVYWLNFKLDLSDTEDKGIHLLRETLARHSVGEIEFMRGTKREEISCLASIIAVSPGRDRPGDIASAGSVIQNICVRHGHVSREESPAEEAGEPDHAGEARGPRRNGGPAAPASKMGKIVRGVLDRLEKIQSREGTRAGAKILEVLEREGGSTATILLLNSLREYDDYTFSHSVNVAVISAAVARSLGFSEEFVDAIAHAALLHDIGKIYVPREIIHKASRLTPSEWQEVKRHPVDGERILREERLDLVSRRVAYEHHMRHDMTGYPSPREGYEAHKASEIVRIADTYDALTTKRPYRQQINPYDAIKLMTKSSGTEFHKDYLGAFLRVLGNIPIGSMLKLNTGETVLVVDLSEANGQLPRVRVLKDASGHEVNDEIIIDLNEREPITNRLKRQITLIMEQSVRDVNVGQYIVS